MKKDVKEGVMEKLVDLNFIRLQFVDILGTPKNIVIPADRAEEALNDGVAFDASSIAGYATIEESDMIAKPDPSSFVILPEVIERRPTAKMNCDIYEPNGKRYGGDPKYALERMMDKAKDMGFIYLTGPECEFFLFRRESDKFVPTDSAGYFDLSHRDLAEDIRADISLALKDFGLVIHTSHHEVAGGQHEINLRHSDALTTADGIITLKYATKVVASLHGLHASFMPKPIYGECGNGMHVHQSLVTLDRKNAFFNSNSNGLSDTATHFIAGLLKYIKELTAVLNPTVNSYKRLVPGYEAPTYISWANRNRSALIRIPSERGKGTRCELRSPDPSGNPYLQFAVMLAAGLNGIEEKLVPPKRVERDVYSLSSSERRALGIEELPDNLRYALALMEESNLVRETLGDHIFNHFLHIKRKEWDEYKTRVTKWEMDEYFPIL